MTKVTEQWVRIGELVRGADGEEIGRVEAVVLSPTLARLTHVSVSPGGTYTEARLVPIVDLEPGVGCVQLASTHRWPGDYPATYEVELLPPADGSEYRLPYPYAADDVLVWDGLETPFGMGIVVREHVPEGETAFYAGTPVTSQDGERIGVIAGFLVHPATQEISHVLLRHGHLWGRRTVLLPLDLIEGFERHTVVVRGTRKDLDRYAID